jgi:hypothetical protein
MSDNLKKAKKIGRVNHVDETIKRKGAGDFTMVPNCIYEMGLSRIERDVWCYLHRAPSWENPTVSEMPKILEVGKTQLMEALEKLQSLNMLVVEGSGASRVFHLPSPAYWNHPTPQKIYAFRKDEKKPVDIGKGVFDGVLNRSKQDEKRPKQDEKRKRPKQDEKSSQTGRKNVPNRTKSKPQTQSSQGVEASSKTLQDSQDVIKSPPSIPQTSLRGGGRLGLTGLDGSLKSLYNQFVTVAMVKPIIRDMAAEASLEQIDEFLKRERRKQPGLRKWGVNDPDMWLDRFHAFLNGSDEEQVIERKPVWEHDPLPPETFDFEKALPH